MPKQIKVAVACLVVYGITVLIQAIWFGVVSHWVDLHGLLRAVVRCVGTVAIAWGMLQGHKWVWWPTVIFGSLIAVFGAAGLAIGLSLGGIHSLPLGILSIIFTLVSTSSLGLGVILLLLPENRQALKRKTGREGGASSNIPNLLTPAVVS